MSDHTCPYCGSDLEHDGVFGKLAGFGPHKIKGDIYRCPKGREESEECESSTFHVAGSFYAYREGDTSLREGYPC